MKDYKFEYFWNEIPTDKDEAVTYSELIASWGASERTVRMILHELSNYDNGDNFVLIRSARSKGFYKTDNIEEIQAYKQECLNKGRSLFAPIKKINRVLSADSTQFKIDNNLRAVRESRNLTQSEVAKSLYFYDCAIDKSMLSKMENNICLPTPYQLSILARLYGCQTSDLVNSEFYY